MIHKYVLVFIQNRKDFYAFPNNVQKDYTKIVYSISSCMSKIKDKLFLSKI